MNIKKITQKTLGNPLFIFSVIVFFIGLAQENPFYYWAFVVVFNLLVYGICFCFYYFFGEKEKEKEEVLSIKRDKEGFLYADGSVEEFADTFDFYVSFMLDRAVDPEMMSTNMKKIIDDLKDEAVEVKKFTNPKK